MEEQHYRNLFKFLQNQQYPADFSDTQNKQLRKQANNYQIFHNLLYKIDKNDSNNKIRVIRRFEMEPTLYIFHNDPTAAHASRDKMFDKMKKRFYWPQMYNNIRDYVESCDQCQRRGKFKRSEPLHPIPVGEHFTK